MATTAVCTHHWLIEPSGKRYSKGVCKHCKEKRQFDNSPSIDGTFSLKPRKGKPE